MINFLQKPLHVCVDAVKLLRDIDSLWTMGYALAATYAMTRLSQLGHTLVIASKKLAPCLVVVLILRSHGHTVFIQALVII